MEVAADPRGLRIPLAARADAAGTPMQGVR